MLNDDPPSTWGSSMPLWDRSMWPGKFDASMGPVYVAQNGKTIEG
jgi:hypothetical protein